MVICFKILRASASATPPPSRLLPSPPPSPPHHSTPSIAILAPLVGTWPLALSPDLRSPQRSSSTPRVDPSPSPSPAAASAAAPPPPRGPR
eukprot:7757434-Pyramimonas_sp.AAC.1